MHSHVTPLGWADAIARKKVGDLKTFETLLLEPLQNDLIQDTWLYERYDSNGNQIRTAYYFEYPSLVAMMLTEIRYGLELNLQSITINPFQSEGTLEYSFSFGVLSVEYSSTGVSVHLPGAGHVRDFTISRLQPSTNYDITYVGASKTCDSLPSLHGKTNDQGSIQFTSPVYSECTLLVTQA